MAHPIDHNHNWDFVWPDRRAAFCDDQLPIVSQVGRGIKGDSYRVTVLENTPPNTPSATQLTRLQGHYYDHAKKEMVDDWTSENINGGELLPVQYNLRPYSVPQTFTMTYIYRRPGRREWAWTTPAIPYLWDADGDGKPDVDGIVGSGVGNFFIRAGKTYPWKDMLVFPKETTPEDYNAPTPYGGGPIDPTILNSSGSTDTSTWGASITFGNDGDIELPNMDELAKIMGWSKDRLRDFINGVPVTSDGITYLNNKNYIDLRDKLLDDTLRGDIGFPSLPSTGGNETVRQYIDRRVNELKQYVDNSITNVNNRIDNMGAKYDKTLGDIVNKFYGGGIINPDGSITWPNNNKAAVGNLNVFSGDNNENYIRTRDGIQLNDQRGGGKL